MGSSGGGGTQTTVQQSEPWTGIRNPLLHGYERAVNEIAGRPQQYFPGETVAPFSPQSESALNWGEARARGGSGLLDSARGYTRGLLTDPASTPVFQSVVSGVRPGIDSAFSRGGRGGSPAHAEALGRGVGHAFAPYAEAAAERSIPLAREDYFDIGQLGQIGATREAKSQQQIDAARQRFEFGQAEPQQRVLSYMQALSGFPGVGGSGTSTTSGLPTSNPWLTAAGLGLGGASALGGLGWQPLSK